MADIVTMPKLGFDMAEGTLVRWVILEGEEVPKGAVLAEIETDKATVEVESVYEGVLTKHLVPEGEIVPVNTPIAVVADAGEEVDVEALVGEIPSTEEAIETTDTAAPAEVSVPIAATEEPDEISALPGGVRASPLARRMASDLRIDLRLVQGSGQAGRVTKKDIEAYLAAPAEAAATPKPGAPAAVEAQPVTAPNALPPLSPAAYEPAPEDQIVSINRLRAAIGRRMTEVKQTVPHFYVTHEYDMADVMELRKQINTMLPEGEKLSVNDFLVKGTALALRQFPNLNATL